MSFKDFTNEEQNKIKDMFNFLDKKNSGQISIEEVQMGIMGLGGELSNKEISELKNKNEFFKYEDFLNLCHKKKINFKDLENKLLLAFSLLETNQKGVITSSSLENLLKNDNVNENDINKIINEAKPDKNKNIDYKYLVKEILEANSDDEEESIGNNNNINVKNNGDNSDED
jgi:Ca2+-binding EF-hand superfamily protein